MAESSNAYFFCPALPQRWRGLCVKCSSVENDVTVEWSTYVKGGLEKCLSRFGKHVLVERGSISLSRSLFERLEL